MRVTVLSLTLASLLAQKAPTPGSIPELRVGQPQSGTIQADDPRLLLDSPTQRLQLASKSDGKVTISVNSFDFDAFLRVESESGDVLADADGGGIETNARLVVELARDKRYHVLVTAQGGGSGWYWIDCQLGERPALSREAIQLAAVAYHGGAANSELAKGKDHRPAAAAHLERKGAILTEQGEFGQAKQAFESARLLWEDCGDPKHAIHATVELGRIASAMKDSPGAEELFSKALTAYRAIPDATGEAQTYLAMAAARAAAGDPAAATSRYQEALGVAEKHADAENAALALAGIAELSRTPGDRETKRETAEKLGDLWRAGGDLEKAREQYQKAVEIARETRDRAAEGAALSNLGEVWLQAREFARARECFERAKEIARETKDGPAQVVALEGLGRVWLKLQDFPKALGFHEQQLVAAGTDPRLAGRAMFRIGVCCLRQHDLTRARSSLESAAEGARVSGDSKAEAEALEFLASVELQGDRKEKAREYRARAFELRKGLEMDQPTVDLWQAVEGLRNGEITLARAQETFETSLEHARSNGDIDLRIEAALWLGQCHAERGRYADAIRCFTEMVDAARTSGKQVDEGRGLELLGQQLLTVGALDTALKHCEQSLAIAREVCDPFAELQALNDVGNAWFELQQTDKAREFYEQVGELGAKHGMPIVQAHALNNVGLAYWKAGRYPESRTSFEQAVQTAAELKAPSQLAEFQGNLARVLRQLGQSERARELATQSLSVLGTPDASEPRKSLIALEALAPLAIAEGDLSGAQVLLERAEFVLEDIRVEAQSAPGDFGADPWILFPPFDRFRQDLVRQTELEGGLGAVERERLLARGFRDADRARARHLASGIVGHRRGTRSKDTLVLRDEWKQALAQLSDKQKEATRAIRDGRPSDEVDRLEQEVLVRRTRASNLGDALRELSPGDAALDLPEGVDPEVLRKTSLAKDCALIEYADGDEDLYAYVLTGSGLSLLELGQRKAVDEVVERYVGMLGAQKGPASPKEIAEVGQELFDLLLAAPLTAAGQGTARLVVVPTPSLAGLPFDALVVSAKPGALAFEELDFVIDHFEVDYCPSAAILALLSSAGPRKLGGKVLVLADPTYPSEERVVEASAPVVAKPSFLAGTRAGDGQEFQRLTKTRDEANTIAALLIQSEEIEAQARLTRLQKERGGSLRASQIDLCLGADASAARLAGDLRPYTYLHLAAHGWVDSQNPEKTGIALAWSGSGEYEGFFTLADAVGLDLDADLVVLSACDTARGKVRVGEGVESMGCAFLNAGARGVVASLWQVKDQAAADTMKSLYSGILEGKRPPEALHAAKVAIRQGSLSRGLTEKAGDPARRAEGNPCDWAPFIHIGLPR
jgi:tetratricopeptide (TPR) repeat protein/CHAT domain-containing protein